MDEHEDLISRLRRLGDDRPTSERQAQDLAAMAAVRGPRPWAGKVRVAAAFLAGLLVGGSGLAAADALPDPAQHVAHTVLDQVGVDVPDPERYHGPECGPEAKRNHGAYVRDDKALAQTDCGKPVKTEGDTGADEDGDAEAGEDARAADGCRGKPPWAKDKSMTAEEKRAAQADRAARCGSDDADDAEGTEELGTTDVEETTTTAAPDATTTTAEAPTTTTEVPTTTEGPTTTAAP